MQAATWWLRRLATSALATRSTWRGACRDTDARRRAGRRGAAERSGPRTALESRRSAVERTHSSERSIVVGYDGADVAKRAIARAAEAAGEHGTVVIVTTEPQLFSSAGRRQNRSRGENFVALMLMGSVAARALEHAGCDVLVVA